TRASWPMRKNRSRPCSRRRYERRRRRRARRPQRTAMNGERKARIGIVGVGRMGLAMLKHLVKHGYQVTACDIDEKQLAKARDAGAATAKTPAEVARAADFVIVAVGYDDEVNQVVLGTDGLLAHLAPGSIIAVSSTAKPDTVKALDARARPASVAILDAPICRRRFAADKGTLLALVAAPPAPGPPA